MEQRTMVKLSASEDCVFLWTVSRGFRSPHRFGISVRELQALEMERHMIVSDIHSFAELRLGRSVKEGNGDMLTVDFTWLSDSGFRRVAGREETIHLPYRQFQEKLEESPELSSRAGRTCGKLRKGKCCGKSWGESSIIIFPGKAAGGS